MAGGRRTVSGYQTLICAAELSECLRNNNISLFDCRHDLADPDAGTRAYVQSHIPGAQFLHLDRDLSGPLSGRNGRHPLPDPHVLASRLAQCGVHKESQVVAYDDSDGIFAARLWWLLRWLGHEKVAVLDGGLGAWCSAGGQSTSEPSAARPSHFGFRLRPCYVGVEDVAAGLHGPDTVLVDARSPDRFRGENETLDPVAGHIPGAVNRFFKLNLRGDGYFKSAELLGEEFRTLLGRRDPRQVVHTCGSGVTACHNLLCMEIAGLTGSRLYPGSWSEWCSDPSRPLASGEH